MSSNREFDNPYPDFAPGREVFKPGTSELKDDIVKQLQENIVKLLKKLEDGLKGEVDWHDYSVYTGTTGIAFLYLHLMNSVHDTGQSKDYMKKAIWFIEKPLASLKGRRLSFMCGDLGPLALGAVLYKRVGMDRESKDLIKRVEKLHKDVIPLDNDLPDEFLFGRVGYLFSLLFIKKHLGEDAIDTAIVKKVVASVVKSGRHLAQKENRNSILMYMWHEKHYLGAAHGLSGILYMLLQAQEYLSAGDLKDLIKPSVDYIMALKFDSGNFPSSLSNSTDRLVHWCHGAPGVIHLAAVAYKVFGDEKYLQAARECGEVIWKRGLLQKGYGICHGVSGNAYAFLLLFQLTHEEKYAYRAVKFAEWCYDYGKHGCRTPDRPLSLFEGLAGTVYFLNDLLHPEQAAFPAFQLF
ncbi:lanC-like protein 2 [Limulus polyphemus]|uniref:LanC-like protein 2 n=1 Tax=Limulus polyphemus TaxID=6850 RepID=A0ABM1BNH9_LIMPO|nr:lanC-like protein 2 [Limulus polyphemus]